MPYETQHFLHIQFGEYIDPQVDIPATGRRRRTEKENYMGLQQIIVELIEAMAKSAVYLYWHTVLIQQFLSRDIQYQYIGLNVLQACNQDFLKEGAE